MGKVNFIFFLHSFMSFFVVVGIADSSQTIIFEEYQNQKNQKRKPNLYDFKRNK